MYVVTIGKESFVESQLLRLSLVCPMFPIDQQGKHDWFALKLCRSFCTKPRVSSSQIYPPTHTHTPIAQNKYLSRDKKMTMPFLSFCAVCVCVCVWYVVTGEASSHQTRCSTHHRRHGRSEHDRHWGHKRCWRWRQVRGVWRQWWGRWWSTWTENRLSTAMIKAEGEGL